MAKGDHHDSKTGKGGGKDRRTRKMTRRSRRPEQRLEPVLSRPASQSASPFASNTEAPPTSRNVSGAPAPTYRVIEQAEAPNWQTDAAIAPDPDTINLAAGNAGPGGRQRPSTQSSPSSVEDKLPARRAAALAAVAAAKNAQSHRPAAPAEGNATALSAAEVRRRRRAERGLFRQTISYIVHWFGAGFALAGMGVALVALAALVLIPGRLPDHRQLQNYQPALRSLVYGGDGKKLAEFAPTNRIYVSLDRIPKRVVNAFLAAEDHRFFEHKGFDLKALVRAALSNAGLYGSSDGLQGGSTITQQVVKNLLLTSERTVERKLKEFILAWRIERSLPKKKILEIYLNEIFMGRTAYGVAAAAREYFGKTLDRLSIAETAFLAGLPQAPSRYNPESRPKIAMARRNYVLGRMQATGLISPEEARLASVQPIKVAPDKQTDRGAAAYFIEEVRRNLRDKFGDKGMAHGGFAVKTTMKRSYQQAARHALRKGLMAYDKRHGWRGPVTSLAKNQDWRNIWKTLLAQVTPPKGHGDWPLALVMSVGRREALIAFANGKTGAIPLAELRWARRQVTIKRKGQPLFKTAGGRAIAKPGDVLKEGDVVLVEAVKTDARGKAYPEGTYALRQIPEVNGAIVALDPRTGRIFALAGGFSFWKSQFNAATQAWRQPGSSFKPFVYLAALEAGLTPATSIPDEPLSIRIDRKTVWKPKNYDGRFRGTMTIRAALASSRNVVAVRLARHAGYATVARTASLFGLSDKTILPVPSMALGSHETTLLRIVAGYGMLANGGKRIRPTLIDKVTDRNGRAIYTHRVPNCPACGDYGPAKKADGAKVSAGAGDTVRPVADPRSVFQLISMMRGVVQRGTGGALRSVGVPVAGKTGTTNDHLDAWFVGFTPDLVVGVWVGYNRPRSLGRREQGGFTAAPIARDFLKSVYKGRKVAEFRPPKGVKKVAVRVESGTDEDGFPVYKTVKDWFKVDPKTGEPLAGELFVAGDDDGDGYGRDDASGEADVYRGSRGRRGRVYTHDRKRQSDKRGYARPDAYGAYGR